MYAIYTSLYTKPSAAAISLASPGNPNIETDVMCELLTPAEVEDTLGQPVASEVIATIDCRYTTVDARMIDATEITVSLARPAWDTVESFVQAIEASAEPGDIAERLGELGDAAVLLTTSDLTILNVMTGDSVITLGVMRPRVPDSAGETLVRLARLALQRVP